MEGAAVFNNRLDIADRVGEVLLDALDAVMSELHDRFPSEVSRITSISNQVLDVVLATLERHDDPSGDDHITRKVGNSAQSPSSPGDKALTVDPTNLQFTRYTLKQSSYRNQSDLARELGLSQGTVSRFLNGKPIKPSNFLEICKKLGLKPENLIASSSSATNDIPENGVVGQVPLTHSLDDCIHPPVNNDMSKRASLSYDLSFNFLSALQDFSSSASCYCGCGEVHLTENQNAAEDATQFNSVDFLPKLTSVNSALKIIEVLESNVSDTYCSCCGGRNCIYELERMNLISVQDIDVLLEGRRLTYSSIWFGADEVKLLSDVAFSILNKYNFNVTRIKNSKYEFFINDGRIDCRISDTYCSCCGGRNCIYELERMNLISVQDIDVLLEGRRLTYSSIWFGADEVKLLSDVAFSILNKYNFNVTRIKNSKYEFFINDGRIDCRISDTYCSCCGGRNCIYELERMNLISVQDIDVLLEGRRLTYSSIWFGAGEVKLLSDVAFSMLNKYNFNVTRIKNSKYEFFINDGRIDCKTSNTWMSGAEIITLRSWIDWIVPQPLRLSFLPFSARSLDLHGFRKQGQDYQEQKFRISVVGTTGVGKSTIINALLSKWIEPSTWFGAGEVKLLSDAVFSILNKYNKYNFDVTLIKNSKYEFFINDGRIDCKTSNTWMSGAEIITLRSRIDWIVPQPLNISVVGTTDSGKLTPTNLLSKWVKLFTLMNALALTLSKITVVSWIASIKPMFNLRKIDIFRMTSYKKEPCRSPPYFCS